MTLRHMKIFLEVYKTENITQAAEALSMTQPAVSRTIQDIERYYGVRLFERINRRLHVTETGKLFYTYALHIVDSFDEMEKGLRDWDELGALRFGASVTLGNSLLPQVLKKFRMTHPNLKLRAVVSNGTQLQEALLNNQLDFAVMGGTIQDAALCRREIASDRLVMILPPDDPRLHWETVTLQDFARDNFLLRENGSMGRDTVDQVFSLHGIPLEPTMESVSTQTIIRAVHEGIGVSILPECLVRYAIDRGYVGTCDLVGEGFVTKNYIVWHRQKFLTESARNLMEVFVEESKCQQASLRPLF